MERGLLEILNSGDKGNFVLVGIVSCGLEVGSAGADESIELGCPRDWNLNKFGAFWRHAIAELGLAAATSPFCQCSSVLA